jgi:hypothetical protein
MSMIDPRGEGGKGGQASGAAWCALCGSQYLAGTANCVDCLVPLVEQPPLSPDDIADEDGEQIAYEYDDLEAEERFVIDRVLADAGIVHAWEGTSLVVAPYDSEEVDRLLDAAADLDEPTGDIDEALLDEDTEQVVYDLADWDGARRTDLDGQLEAEGIPHAFDESGDLVVLAADEDRVDAIIDAIDFPDQLDADHDGDDGGLHAVEALGRLFVASDQLVHDPTSPDGTMAAVEAARTLAPMPTPFGFGPPVWTDLLARADALRQLLETDAEIVDDDAVLAAATELRTALRPHI